MQQKVLIIGGGFAGINTAQKLKNAPVDITLVDRTNHHLFQPFLYQVASAALTSSDIATPLREIFRNQENVRIIMSEAVSIDTEKQIVTLTHCDPIPYDYLVLATGAKHSYFGNEIWEEFAPGLKTLEDAQAIREHILRSFEIAERSHNRFEIQHYLNFVMIGAGPTGVEMAGAIAEIAYKTMLKDFTQIDVKKSCIYLIEAASDVLPTFKPLLRQRAREDLEKLGVIVLTGHKVVDINSDGVLTDNLFIPTKNAIWCAGTEAGPLLKTLNVPLDRQGRIFAEEDLTVPGFPNIFVIGDAAAIKDNKGRIIPGVAPAAIQEGLYVGKIIAGGKRKPFKYFDKGSMATIGLYKAVASVGVLNFTGHLAWIAWCFIHIAYLVTFRSRFLVIVQWLFWLISGKRGSRIITGSLKEDVTLHP
ncbi:MAG: NAD(P)/FAD-dependent oxidoreductase [Chlamydiae bacterium]|nr:NAD(P)/FAD-dependent oxidoreductase [Chlamydiota bacterium]